MQWGKLSVNKKYICNFTNIGVYIWCPTQINQIYNPNSNQQNICNGALSPLDIMKDIEYVGAE